MEAYETALIGRPRPFPRCHDSNANSMAANVDVDETQKASGWLGSRLVNDSDIV